MQQRQPVPPPKPLPSGARRPHGNIGAKVQQSLGGTCTSDGSSTTAAGATGDAETWAQGGFGTSSGSTAGCSAPSSLGLGGTRTRTADGLDSQADEVRARVAAFLVGALHSGDLRHAVTVVSERKAVGSSSEDVRKRVAASLVLAASSGQLSSAVQEVVVERGGVADLRKRVSDALVSVANTGELRQRIAEVSSGNGLCRTAESAERSGGIPKELLFGSDKHVQSRTAESAERSGGIPKELLFGSDKHVQSRAAEVLATGFESGGLGRAQLQKRAANALLGAFQSGTLRGTLAEVTGAEGSGHSSGSDNVLQLRRRVADALVKSAESGELRRKIGEVSASIPKELLFGGDKHVQKRAAEILADGVLSGDVRDAQVQKRAADVLASGFQSGKLQTQTRAPGADLAKSAESGELSRELLFGSDKFVKQRALECLAKACESGGLLPALLQSRVADTLSTAFESGKLHGALAEIAGMSGSGHASSSSDPFPRRVESAETFHGIPRELLFGSDKHVQKRAAEILTIAGESGQLGQALMQKRAADAILAGFESGKLRTGVVADASRSESKTLHGIPRELLFGSDKHVQKRAAEILTTAGQSGQLLEVRLQKRAADVLDAGFKSGNLQTAVAEGTGRRAEELRTSNGIPRELLYGSDKHVQKRAAEILTTAGESGQLLDVQVQKRAADVLGAGFKSGNLQTAVADGTGRRLDESDTFHGLPRELLFGSDKHVQKRAAETLTDAEESGRLLQVQLQKRAADVLAAGFKSGQLQTAVAEGTGRRVAKLLRDSTASGALDRALADLSSTSHVRERVALLLDDAVESHKLEKVLQTVSPKQQSAQPSDGGKLAEQAPIAAVGQSVQEGLVDAQRSGRLEELLEGTLGRTEVAPPPRAEGARRSSAPELDAARSKAAGDMVRALHNGELGDILQTMKADMTPQQMREVEKMRRRSVNRLGNASDLGHLRKAMMSVKQEREACVDAAAKLQGAFESGTLREALQAAQQQRLAKLQSASESGALREALQAAKENRPAGPPGPGKPAGQPGGAAQLAAKQLEAGKPALPQRQASPLLFVQEGKPQQPAQEASQALLEALSVRGRRLGELHAAVEITKRLIAERAERCRQVENQVGSTKADLAHLELDIEWHRHALEQAADRSSDLEAACRKARSQMTPRLPAMCETSTGQPEDASK